ncbi:phosphonate ABC transporter ATP-binding protein [Paenibacillus alvei]
METILKITNLAKTYNGGTLALKDINLEVKKGEFIAVIGPSGAGKSTLLRSINRLIEPTEGTIEFLNQHIEKVNKNELRKIRSKMGMIFQHYNLIYRSSVLENVLHGRLGYMGSLAGVFNRYKEADKREAIMLLEKVGLEAEIYKRADELSGGQKQRVGVCRALAQNPELILADEPIASLDPKSSTVVMDAIYKNCKDQGIACLVNLHQVDVAKRYATRIVAVKAGTIIFDGEASELTDAMIKYLYEGIEQEMLEQAN